MMVSHVDSARVGISKAYDRRLARAVYRNFAKGGGANLGYVKKREGRKLTIVLCFKNHRNVRGGRE